MFSDEGIPLCKPALFRFPEFRVLRRSLLLFAIIFIIQLCKLFFESTNADIVFFDTRVPFALQFIQHSRVFLCQLLVFLLGFLSYGFQDIAGMLAGGGGGGYPPHAGRRRPVHRRRLVVLEVLQACIKVLPNTGCALASFVRSCLLVSEENIILTFFMAAERELSLVLCFLCCSGSDEKLFGGCVQLLRSAIAFFGNLEVERTAVASRGGGSTAG